MWGEFFQVAAILQRWALLNRVDLRDWEQHALALRLFRCLDLSKLQAPLPEPAVQLAESLVPLPLWVPSESGRRRERRRRRRHFSPKRRPDW